MKHLSVTWKGITPLLMHDNKCVNPLHPLAIELRKWTSIQTKKKTEEVYRIISDLEWEAGAYWKDEIGLYIPAENVEQTLIGGAKHFKKGTDVGRYCAVEPLYIPLDYGEKLTKEQLIADYKYRDTRAVGVNRSSVPRTRPRFETWKIEFVLRYDEERIDFETIMNSMDFAGQYVGLCDYRPKYGKFVASVSEID